jgi:hypothetical protein
VIDPTISIGIIFGGFAVFAEKLADLLSKLRAERIRRNDLAAEYFETLAESMTKAVEGLRANQIPRIDGHTVQELLHAFPERTKAVSRLESPETLKASLNHAANIAKELDGWLLMNVPSIPSERDEMLAIIERIAGHCAGIAATLKHAA